MPNTIGDVLVVEDDDATREALRALFEDEGYAVHEAQDGETALRRLRAHPRPLVALLDWQLPGLDGLHVPAALAAAAADPPPAARRHAFLLMTAATVNEAHPLPPLPDGLDIAVLLKPFDVDALTALVAAAAERVAVAVAKPGR